MQMKEKARRRSESAIGAAQTNEVFERRDRLQLAACIGINTSRHQSFCDSALRAASGALKMSAQSWKAAKQAMRKQMRATLANLPDSVVASECEAHLKLGTFLS